MPVLYTNNAATTLASGITAAATSLTVASGKGALFPAPSSPSYFYATLSNADGSLLEIVKVTARATDTFTITRAQDGTSALAWNAGDKIELRITKSMLDDFKTDTNAALTSSNVTTALGYTPYNATNPNGYTANTGTVTSVSGTGTASGLTLSGTVTSSGSLTLSGTVNALAEGTYGISISGNAATATNISNTGTVTLASATESNSIYITAPSYTMDTPVKLLNFDWYGNMFSMGNIRSGSTPSSGFGIYYTASGGSRTEIARFGTGGSFNAVGAITQNGNQVLHSGNYTSYAPSLTGSGASGTWGINVTGYAKYLSGAPAYTNGTDGWWRSAGQAGWYNSDYAVGIYATEAGNVRTYNGANFIAAGNVTAYSDERLKKNWKNLDANFIEQLAQVKCGTYERTDNEFAKVQVGASAQSLRNVLPEAILEDAEGILSVAYGNAALVAAIKLAERVVELEARLNAVEAK